MTGQSQGLTCPGCQQPAAFALGNPPTQAFCGNAAGCQVLCWNPQLSLAEGMADVNVIDLDGKG